MQYNNMTFKNLLLLDTRIKDLNEIINSIQKETTYILINYFNDTFETILNKINSLNINRLTSIGLVRHGYYLPTYKFIDKQLIPSIIQNVEINDSNIETWNEIIEFLPLFNEFKLSQENNSIVGNLETKKRILKNKLYCFIYERLNKVYEIKDTCPIRDNIDKYVDHSIDETDFNDKGKYEKKYLKYKNKYLNLKKVNK